MNTSFLLTLPLITDSEQLLLWMQIILVWCIANYMIGNDPVGRVAITDQTETEFKNWRRIVLGRSIAITLITCLLPGFNLNRVWGRLLLGGVVLIFAVALPLLRPRIATSRTVIKNLMAEWEILSNVAFIVTTAYIIAITDLRVIADDSLLHVPATSNRLSAILLVSASVIFIVKAGTHIVRGVLDKADTLPRVEDEDNAPPQLAEKGEANTRAEGAVDKKEFNRGRIIGNLERVLLLIIVLQGSYEAIGFIVAGKGLIRAKEFESRDFAEYFIVGTLTSTTLAIVVGLILKIALSLLW